MKKCSLVVLLVLLMLFSFAACGSNNENAPDDSFTASDSNNENAPDDSFAYGTWKSFGLSYEDSDIFPTENAVTLIISKEGTLKTSFFDGTLTWIRSSGFGDQYDLDDLLWEALVFSGDTVVGSAAIFKLDDKMVLMFASTTGNDDLVTIYFTK